MATKALIEQRTRDLDGAISDRDAQEMGRRTSAQQRVYGEITFDGVCIFMDHCLARSQELRPRGGGRHGEAPEHVFYDLGSGVGRMVLQVGLDYCSPGPVRRSVGVELSQERHTAAVDAWQRMRAELALGGEREALDEATCELIHGDILDAQLSEATIAWVANSFFTEEFLQRLCDKLAVEAPQLQFVGFNDALGEWGVELRGFSLDAALHVPMSWDGEATAYVYKRIDNVASGAAPRMLSLGANEAKELEEAELVAGANEQKPTAAAELARQGNGVDVERPLSAAEGHRPLGREEARHIVNLLWSLLFNEEENEDVVLYDLAESEESAVELTGGDATYGEASFDLLDWLLDTARVGSEDVVCDLGSGSGRALLYLALRGGCKVVGVELSPARHLVAERLFHLAAPFLAAPAVLHKGDITSSGPQTAATVVLFANRLFEEGFSRMALATVPQARRLLTLRAIEDWGHCAAMSALPTTWMHAQPVWLYERT